MLLARGVTRAPELGMRLALGAARVRVVRLLVVESLSVSLAGAIVGLGVAWGVIRLVERTIPLMPNLDFSINLGIDWRVIAFSFVLAAVTGLASGLGPALAATRVELASTLNRDRAGAAPRLRARSTFVVVQVALSVVLAVCALLLTRSIRHASQINSGLPYCGSRGHRAQPSIGGIRHRAGTSVRRCSHDADSEFAGAGGGGFGSCRAVDDGAGGRPFLAAGRVRQRACNRREPEHRDARLLPNGGLELLAGRNSEEADRPRRSSRGHCQRDPRAAGMARQMPSANTSWWAPAARPVDVIGVVRDAKYPQSAKARRRSSTSRPRSATSPSRGFWCARPVRA